MKSPSKDQAALSSLSYLVSFDCNKLKLIIHTDESNFKHNNI